MQRRVLQRGLPLKNSACVPYQRGGLPAMSGPKIPWLFSDSPDLNLNFPWLFKW